MSVSSEEWNRAWAMIEKLTEAREEEFWLEAISLEYQIFCLYLRHFMTQTAAGPADQPPSEERVGEQDYLMQLANMAKDNEFLDPDTWKKVREFNTARKDAIHELAQGAIDYPDLEPVAHGYGELVSAIQEEYMTWEVGEVETLEDFLQRCENCGVELGGDVDQLIKRGDVYHCPNCNEVLVGSST